MAANLIFFAKLSDLLCVNKECFNGPAPLFSSVHSGGDKL